MDAELMMLLRTTLVLTVACVLVLCLRRPARSLWGAQGAYLLWACVPLAVVASLLPKQAGVAMQVPVAEAWLAPLQAGVVAVAGVGASAWQGWLLPAWLAGAVATALLLGWQQWRFRRALGRLQERQRGVFQASVQSAALPAVVGVLRPRILLPADFEQRYSEPERALILQHERLHVRRGDLMANALAALLRCLFWFHPLLPMALRRFRHDQELACDAGVVARHPGQRRVYGEAMLKAQLPQSSTVPLGCHWPFRHPLKERIEMLKHPVQSSRQRIAAVLSVSLLALGTACMAWAAQPARASVPAGNAAQQQAQVPHDPSPLPATHMPAPRYPKDAADARVAGLVVLLLDVDAEGRVTGVEVENASPAGVFEAAAMEAALQWRFNPQADDGIALPSRVRVPISFELDQPAAEEGGQA